MGNYVETEREEPESPRTDDAFGKVKFPEVELPHDSEGYCQSFTIDQEEEYLKFFDTYGFVVINDILSKQEYEEHIDEFWTELESENWSCFQKEETHVDRNDSNTWSNKYFPASSAGIFGNDISTGKCSWKNRQNPKMYQVFSKIYGTPKLWVSLDRMGIMRPSVGVPFGKLVPTKARTSALPEENPELPVANFPEWQTRPLWLHWDLNPWVWTGSNEGVDYSFNDFIQENNGSRNNGLRKLQGILTLSDSRVGDGGFCCVPGFHRVLKEYSEQTAKTEYCRRLKRSFSFVNVHPSDCMNAQAKKISCRPGSLIAWSSELPHCNYPNASNHFRINQYVKMFPAQEGRPNTDVRQQTLAALTKSIDVTPLGKKLFGLESWEESPKQQVSE